MFTLPKEEVEKLLTHADPAVVAATKKLIAVEEAGEFVPKSRLTQETKEAKELREKLDAFEKAQKQTEEDRLKKSGEFEKLLDAEKEEHLKTKSQLEQEKKEADQMRAYRKSVVEAVKAKLGDEWLPEYEDFSIESLSKIAKQPLPVIPTAKGAGKPPESDTFTRDEVKAHEGDKAWMTANFEKVQKSISSWGK